MHIVGKVFTAMNNIRLAKLTVTPLRNDLKSNIKIRNRISLNNLNGTNIQVDQDKQRLELNFYFLID